jgi:hypothetical protein
MVLKDGITRRIMDRRERNRLGVNYCCFEKITKKNEALDNVWKTLVVGNC